MSRSFISLAPYLATFALLMAIPASASALRCSNQIIREGDREPRVEEHCGDPTDVERRVERRAVTVHRRGPNGSVVSVTREVEVEYERWTYDFGPNRLIHYLTFEDGVLIDVETGGYGSSRSR